MRFYIDKNKTGKEGKCIVRLYCSVGSRYIRLNTGITIEPDSWNVATQRVSKGRYARQINFALDSISHRVNEFVLSCIESGRVDRVNKANLARVILQGSTSSTEFEVFFRSVIETKRGRTKELYQRTLKKVLAFDSIPEFSTINRTWLDRFDLSMSKLAINTRAIHLRNLRNVINCAIDDGYTSNYPFRRWKIRTEETPMRSLSIEKMRWLLHADLQVHYVEYRDIFLLILYLRGINIVDLSRLTPDSIRDGRLEYRRSKTRALYSIKLEPEALEIIERYRGTQKLLAPFERYKDYKDYAKHVNDALQRMGPVKRRPDGKPVKTRNGLYVMEPIQPDLTTYFARYSWATYAAHIGIQRDTISEGLGHQYGSRVTGIYIQFDRQKVDDANRAVIDYLHSTL